MPAAGVEYDTPLRIPEFGSEMTWHTWRNEIEESFRPSASADHPETVDRNVFARVAKGYGTSVCEQEEEL
jgi:hypothetical protein